MAYRYYQGEATEAVFDYWKAEAGHPLVDMATGTGKSMTMGKLTHEMITGWPDMRVMNCTHVIELVEGNFKELIGIYPFAPAGIFAASLGRRDYRAQILFAQLQTVWNKAHLIGHVDVLLIDEVQLVPADGNTMYRKLIDALLVINPDMKITGFTATPYRLDSGRLDEGSDRLFNKVVYTYGIRQGIDDGYLTPITSTPTSTRQDISGVGKLGGDFKKNALAKAVDKEAINRPILEEVFDVEGQRKKSLFFCAGIEHATHVRDLVRECGRSCEVIHGKTPANERRTLIEAYKQGEIWGITNDNVMSTGTNVPGIDLIVDMAATASPGRYVQRVGRGTRVVYPPGFDPESHSAEGRRQAISGHIKPNCRYMDFAGNLNRHGPVDMIEPKGAATGDGEAPIKLCPPNIADIRGKYGCEEQLHASVRRCWKCGYEFPEPKLKLLDTAADAPIISSAAPETRKVRSRSFYYHEGKPGKPDSIKTSYMVGMKSINEWHCPAHQGFAKAKADRFWMLHGGQRPFPKTPIEWLERQNELLVTEEIEVKPAGKYWDVVGHKPGTERQSEPVEDGWDYHSQKYEDIPF